MRFDLSRLSVKSSGPRELVDDLMVVFTLLGYSNVYVDTHYDAISPGEKVCVWGTHPDGNIIKLLQIKFFKNGNKHLQFDQQAMLRFNVTVSRILGWVKNKAQFEDESEAEQSIEGEVWDIADEMKVLPSTVLKLTNQGGVH